MKQVFRFDTPTRKAEITQQSGVSLPGIFIHLRCCLDSGQMNNIKTTFGGCFAIVAGFSPTNRARQRHWANGQIFSADHAGSMSQILACNRACRYTVQTVITYLGTTSPATGGATLRGGAFSSELCYPGEDQELGRWTAPLVWLP